MAIGTAINIVGAGLLTTVGTSTSTALSASYLVIAGAGAGIGGNQPFTALQAVLSDDDLPIGNGLTVFGLQLGTSIAFAISQTVFLTKVFHVLENDPATMMITRPEILQAGAAKLEKLVSDPKALMVIRRAYSSGTRDTMIVALVSIWLSLLCVPGMEWLKLGEGTETDKKSEIKQDHPERCEEEAIASKKTH